MRTRCKQLLDILKKNTKKGLTVLDMTNYPHYHTDCRKEISELRRMGKRNGFAIADMWETNRLRTARFKRYFYKTTKKTWTERKVW